MPFAKFEIDALTDLKDAFGVSDIRTVPLDELVREARQHFPNNLSEELCYEIMNTLRNYIRPDSLKYTTPDSFLEYYPQFAHRSPEEIDILYQTANAMNMYLLIMAPRRKKMWAITIVPRLIEGPHVRYGLY